MSFFVSVNAISIRSIVKYNRISPITVFKLGEFAIPANFKKATQISVATKNNYLNASDIEAVWSDEYDSPVKAGTDSFYVESSDFPILEVIRILVTVFGDYSLFKKALSEFEKFQGKFTPERSSVIVNALVPMMHFIREYNNPEGIFTKTEKKDYSKGYFHYRNINVYYPPSFKIANYDIKISVKWNAENKYDSTQSFYLDTKEVFYPNIHVVDGMHIELQKSMMQFLKQIVDFLENRGLMGRLGIPI